jgi:hypothetical protein
MDAQFREAQERARRRARAIYELARAGSGIWRGAAIAAAVALVAVWRHEMAGVPLAALSLGTIALVEWWGGRLAAGARVGLGGGFLALLAPDSLLRPCCAAHAGMAATCDCGMIASGCLAAGAAIGLLVGALLPRMACARCAPSVAGGALAAISVAAARCPGLVRGESLGLLGGIVVGVVVTGALSAWLRPTVA